jgi:prepilin-type N-terminal cleavage/methylation domain-containing protein
MSPGNHSRTRRGFTLVELLVVIAIIGMLFDYGRCVEVGGPDGSNPCKRAWGSLHPGGLHFSFGDTSIRFLDTSIDMQIFAAMATMAGEEIIDY